MKVLNGRVALCLRPGDGDHIETHGAIQQIMSLEEDQCSASDPALLVVIDGFSWMSGFVRAARLDFDEDYRLPIDSDEVDFTKTVSMLPGHNCVTLSAEKAFGPTFPTQS